MNLRCGKKLVNNSRMFKKSDLNKMEVPSVPGQIYLHIAKGENPEVVKKIFKEDMVNILFPESLDKSPLEHIKSCKESNADAVISFAGRTDSAEKVKEKLDLLKIGHSDKKDNMFVIDYSCNDDIFLLMHPYSDHIDAVGIYIGSYFYGDTGFRAVARKAWMIRKTLQKPVFIFGSPIKVYGDNNKDSRFFPFYGLISEAWSKCWRQIKPSEEKIKIIDTDDYTCKEYNQMLTKLGKPGATVPRTDKTLFEFVKMSSEERKEYDSMILDEELVTLTSLSPGALQEFLISRTHSAYTESLLSSWKAKVIDDTILNVNELSTGWDLAELRKRIDYEASRVTPAQAKRAGETAFNWMIELINENKKPQMNEYLEQFKIGLTNTTS